MDNFKKVPKPAAGRARTVDGFILRVDNVKKHSNREPFLRKKSLLPDPSPRVANFRQTDGFHPNIQPTLGPNQINPSSALSAVDGSIALDMPISPPKVRRKKKRNWKKRIFWSFIVTLLIVLGVGGFLVAKGYIKLHNVFKGGAAGAPALQQNVDPSKLKGEGDGRVNILLLGKGGIGHDGPDLTDTILIASIDPIQNTAAILSVPRDFWVKEGNHSVKINQLYADAKYSVLGGKKTPDQAAQAEAAGFKAIEDGLTNVLGIPIHYHVMIDFKAFRDAVNTVGGIDLNAPTSLYEVQWLEDIHKNYVLDVKPGVSHFDGVRALAYARSRHTSPRGDFDRTERQRAMIVALKEKILSLGTYSNPIRISQLLDAFGNHVEANLNTNEIMRLYDISKKIDNSKVQSIGLADPPNNFVKTSDIGGLSVVVPSAGLYDYTDIRNYVRNTLKDGYILNENASITVLNGSLTPGLATAKANELKSFGYTINTIADAPTKDYTSTILVDLTKGVKKYTKHYLEQRLGVTSVTSLPNTSISPGSADFVIILGKNESTAN